MAASNSPSLLERLGLHASERLLIITCDDLGSSHAANLGVFAALREKGATVASLMVPCPWARSAAADYRGEDVGVHLTLNCEWDRYRWGPVTHSPSLLDGDGGFPRTVGDLFDHAVLDEVGRECRAQLERAVYWGFDVSHLATHLGALTARAELFDVYLTLAEEFGLPVRLPPASEERSLGFPARALATERGLLAPDHVWRSPATIDRATWERVLLELPEGVTEAIFHPARDTPELRGISPDWEWRAGQLAALTRSPSIRSMAEAAGVRVIGYRELKNLM